MNLLLIEENVNSNNLRGIIISYTKFIEETKLW